MLFSRGKGRCRKYVDAGRLQGRASFLRKDGASKRRYYNLPPRNQKKGESCPIDCAGQCNSPSMKRAKEKSPERRGPTISSGGK